MQRTSTSSPATSRRPGQLDLLQAQAGPGALFAYGTLQFPGVLSALLRRVPEHAAGTAVGWRAAALAARNYPGMVRAGRATATGILITGLTPAEWRLIDTYEDDFYELRQLTLADGRRGWTYAWVNHADVAAHDWSAPDFAARHLAEFTERCRAWRQRYDTTGQPGHVTGHHLDRPARDPPSTRPAQHETRPARDPPSTRPAHRPRYKIRPGPEPLPEPGPDSRARRRGG